MFPISISKQVLANAHKDPLAARASVQLRRNGLSGPGVANAAGGGVYDDTPPPMPVCLVSTAWAAVIGTTDWASQLGGEGIGKRRVVFFNWHGHRSVQPPTGMA
jgi:hypothetical protein